ncbi:hypothetical protein BCR37DRAFT_375580 [Protomyces lactucae-debilis]|uniref:ditrans,polycis-polyprenyl diphosphate synthase [(2E,6E)-farnesyldiphosphate specific] n=1 Tax=Protomyces lactucae-debilis TaxID=2754530 RepID=A0A1Y2FUR1_PROLT|nr:uncharacterized protein BCR37DRAFT_375580 [Protomyces lactucae-debilis]ORY87699.1 hypothetical protein BCR37DRAFT_375580 [Protomyces lactucae-debilis]
MAVDRPQASGPKYKHTPGKQLDILQRKQEQGHSIVLLGVLYYLHLLYFLYACIRAFLSRGYDLITGFILTSSSKELIKSDIANLTKIPSHLAVVICGDLESLVNDVADLSVWCICCNIPILTIYERSGQLKGMDAPLQVAIKRKLRRFFRDSKKVSLYTPGWGTENTNEYDGDGGLADLEVNLISSEDGREALLDLTRSLCLLAAGTEEETTAQQQQVNGKSPTILINGSSQTNGKAPSRTSSPFATGSLRKSITRRNHKSAHDGNEVESPIASRPGSAMSNGSDASRYTDALTQQPQTQSSAAPPAPARQHSSGGVHISSSDITIPFLDAHITDVTIPEPNLLLIFTGHPGSRPSSASSASGEPAAAGYTLDGFPPWSLRLCEICWIKVAGGHVSYRGFLRGLQRFGHAEMRWGR